MSSTRPQSLRTAASKRAKASEADRILLLIGASGMAIAEAGETSGQVRIAPPGGRRARFAATAVDELARDGLVVWGAGPAKKRMLLLTETGRAKLARLGAPGPDAFRAQHADLRSTTLTDDEGAHAVTINEAENPLLWLHRRRGPDGEPLISAVQFAAGERLRVDLTQAQIMPRVTANWSAAVASGPRGADPGVATDAMIAARQRVDRAVGAMGPEFAGLLIDVCGFLKRLPDIERERAWPARSAKLVLDMALSRLARHYGLSEEARGPDRAGVKFWGAADYRPRMDAA